MAKQKAGKIHFGCGSFCYYSVKSMAAIRVTSKPKECFVHDLRQPLEHTAFGSHVQLVACQIHPALHHQTAPFADWSRGLIA